VFLDLSYDKIISLKFWVQCSTLKVFEGEITFFSALLNKFHHTPKKNIVRGRWYIYLEQTISHLCRPISCWLSTLADEYHLLRTIISYVAWYSSPSADDIQLKQMIFIWRGWYSSRADNIQLKQMILIWRGRYSSRADDIHQMETIFIQERWIPYMLIFEITINHWRWYLTTGDLNQPLGMIINHWGW
jgi:hypothetical protein